VDIELVLQRGRGVEALKLYRERTVSCTTIKEDPHGFRCILGDLNCISVPTTRAAALQGMLVAHDEGVERSRKLPKMTLQAQL